jgi:hypothetical protein
VAVKQEGCRSFKRTGYRQITKDKDKDRDRDRDLDKDQRKE